MRRLLLLGCAALLVGCGGSPTRKPAAGLVPWSGVVPPSLQQPTVTAAPACRPSQLAIVGGGLGFVSSPAGATATLTLRNTGAACNLAGTPRLRFVGAPRMPEQRQVDVAAAPPQFPALQPPSSTLRALAPGASAILLVDWRNWCVPGARSVGGPLIPPKVARLTLPGGGSLDVEYNAVTPCVQPGAPSTVTVRPFEPALLPAQTPWTTGRVTARILALDGEAGELKAKPGETLRYAVELTNPGTSTVRFTRCPLVAQLVAPVGRIAATRLNCAAAHPLKPGGVERFEMRVRIPAGAPAGVNGLFWELDPLGTQAPEVVGRVRVSDRR